MNTPVKTIAVVKSPTSVDELIEDVRLLRWLQRIYRESLSPLARREVERLEAVVDARLEAIDKEAGRDVAGLQAAYAVKFAKVLPPAKKGGAR